MQPLAQSTWLLFQLHCLGSDRGCKCLESPREGEELDMSGRGHCPPGVLGGLDARTGSLLGRVENKSSEATSLQGCRLRKGIERPVRRSQLRAARLNILHLGGSLTLASTSHLSFG